MTDRVFLTSLKMVKRFFANMARMGIANEDENGRAAHPCEPPPWFAVGPWRIRPHPLNERFFANMARMNMARMGIANEDENGRAAHPCEPPPPAVDWAHRAALGIVADLCDRREVKRGFDEIDADVRAEIVSSMAEIIREALKTATPPYD